MAEVSPQHPLSNVKLPAGLYLVATPIGSARDITLRALDVLANADVLAAEDTRVLRKLMAIHGIPLEGRHIVAYHDHNARGAGDKLLEQIKGGHAVALTSDAGTPLIADPGYDLVARAREAGLMVTSAPGASAIVTALSLSGLPTDRFMFAGFAPQKTTARKAFLQELSQKDCVIAVYESPNRVVACVRDMIELFGPERRLCVARELTKKFEQVVTKPLGDIADALGETIPLKGEFVLLLDKIANAPVDAEDVKVFIREELTKSGVKDAAAQAAQRFGIPRKEAYSLALSLKDD